MDHPLGPVFLKYRIDQFSIGDIRLYKLIVRSVLNIREICQVPGIGQHIKVYDFIFRVFCYKPPDNM